MRNGGFRLMAAGMVLATGITAGGLARASGLMDSIGQLSGAATGGSASGGAGGLGSLLSSGSLTSGSTDNVAGILQFCVQNNYLSADAASGVKDQLLQKINGGTAPTSDSAYKDGANGILNSSNGSKIDLDGDGIKKQVTKKACDYILKQGKSLL
ncbi:MAG: DUF2501 domain-containing protein [Parvibaculaceae bacterium]|nr:DUF2501 domain-containing protein [Parvibaculaceae bacterium]